MIFLTLYTCCIFKTVVETGSFIKASKELNLTPSAISHAISAFEDEVGFPLFIRTRTGVRLTVNGEKLLPDILRLLRDEEHLKQEAFQIKGISNGTVRIASISSITISWLTKIIKSFKEKYPNINVHLYEGGYDDIKYWVDTAAVDIAFVTKDLLPDRDVLLLHKDMMMCLTPKDFIPENETYITGEELKEFPIIMQVHGNSRDISRILKKYSISSDASYYIRSNSAIMSMVENGLGMSILPKLLFEYDTHNINLYPFNPPEYRTIGIYCLYPESISPAAKKMRDEILSFMQKNDLINI